MLLWRHCAARALYARYATRLCQGRCIARTNPPDPLRPRRCATCAALVATSCSRLPAAAADAAPKGTLRVALSIGETSFDPAFANDAASDGVIANVFDTLLDYDYLARPVKLVPRARAAMPDVADNGRTFTFHLRKGIRFPPDPAFGGKPRELTAGDFAYGFKRHARSGAALAVAVADRGQARGRRRGAGERRAKTGKFDYDAPISGTRGRRPLHAAHPPHRRRISASRTWSRSPTCARRRARWSSATARDIGAHPVGTGPLHARRVPAQQPHRARGESRLSRVDLRRRPDRSPRRRSPSPRR